MSDTQPISLLQKTLTELGITPQQNRITLYDPTAEFPKSNEAEMPIFDEDRHGNMTILIYGIDQTVIRYEKKGSNGKMSGLNAKEVILRATRWAEPRVMPNGDVRKYDFPKGQPTYPFFPPNLCRKYNAKETLETLVITEGYKKAFKADMHGVDIIGLGSISHWRDKNTGQLHGDIIKVLQRCQPKNVIWLADGDCRSITHKEITELTDLYKRPNLFYASVNTFCDLVDENKYNCKKYFAYQRTEDIEGNPKGLDDLYCQFTGRENEVTEALLSQGVKTEDCYQNSLFTRLDVTFGPLKVRKHLHLTSIEEFYAYHADRRPDLKNKPFVYAGTTYQFDSETGTVKIVTPGDASDYIRVATDYFRLVNRPSVDGSFSLTLQPWNRGTIVDDKGQKFLKYIPKYKSFCIVPDHFNYQPVINDCYNLYFPIKHEIERGETGTEEDFPVIMDFLHHIFGHSTRKFTYIPKGGEEKTVTLDIRAVDMALDYISLLLNRPTQMLPILCLVSAERQTGKNTFLDLLKMIFESNMTFVGNEDLKNEFNKHWSSKLIVACDEAKIDKHEVVEKVKRLATAKKATMNSKGKDQSEMDFFAKFIFTSNNEDNFLPIDEKEIRFWVVKVPPFKVLNNGILAEFRAELPAFLWFLRNRKIVTPDMERHWFPTELLRTEALKKLVKNAEPTIIKEIRTYLREMFELIDDDEIKMTKSVVRKLILNNRGELNYIERILETNLGLKKMEGSGGKYYTYPVIKQNADKPEICYEKEIGRYYTFKREVFAPGPKVELLDNSIQITGEAKDKTAASNQGDDDLPF